MDTPFIEAAPLLSEIERAGYEAYFVGGSVRDLLSGRPIHDVDIATSASPEEIKQIFQRTVDVGIAHGTVLVLYRGGAYEVTTFRKEEGYSDFRRPDQVEFIRSLEEDLKRRDFTMNAIAMDKDGRIIDPFHGREAVKNRRITAVGSPDERFQEDALRMMRAVRFVSQLGFAPDDNIIGSIHTYKGLLSRISTERILAEFEKTLNGTYRKKGLGLLLQTGLYRYLPEFSEAGEVLLSFIENPYTEQLDSAAECWAVLCMLLQTENIKEFAAKWKMSNQSAKYIKKLAALAGCKDYIREPIQLLDAGEEDSLRGARILSVLLKEDPASFVRQAAEAYEKLPIKSRDELQINGSDLMAWSGSKPGPWIKEALSRSLSAVLSGEIVNTKESIKEWLDRCRLI